MPMMSDLIEAYVLHPRDQAICAALRDALIVTGPLRHGLRRWQAAPGQVLVQYAYWWGWEDLHPAADTPIPR